MTQILRSISDSNIINLNPNTNFIILEIILLYFAQAITNISFYFAMDFNS